MTSKNHRMWLVPIALIPAVVLYLSWEPQSSRVEQPEVSKKPVSAFLGSDGPALPGVARGLRFDMTRAEVEATGLPIGQSEWHELRIDGYTAAIRVSLEYNRDHGGLEAVEVRLDKDVCLEDLPAIWGKVAHEHWPFSKTRELFWYSPERSLRARARVMEHTCFLKLEPYTPIHSLVAEALTPGGVDMLGLPESELEALLGPRIREKRNHSHTYRMPPLTNANWTAVHISSGRDGRVDSWWLHLDDTDMSPGFSDAFKAALEASYGKPVLKEDGNVMEYDFNVTLERRWGGLSLKVGSRVSSRPLSF